MKYCALLFGVMALIASVQAQTPDLRPLGTGLYDIDYLYPVHFFDLTIEGQMLRMAHVDVAPSRPASACSAPLVFAAA